MHFRELGEFSEFICYRKWPPTSRAPMVIFAKSDEYGHVVPHFSWICVLLPFLTTTTSVQHSSGHQKLLKTIWPPVLSESIVIFFKWPLEWPYSTSFLLEFCSLTEFENLIKMFGLIKFWPGGL